MLEQLLMFEMILQMELGSFLLLQSCQLMRCRTMQLELGQLLRLELGRLL